MERFTNKRYIAMQIGIMMTKQGDKPNINKIYRMSQNKMKALFNDLRQQEAK